MRESIYIRLPTAGGNACWAIRSAVDGRFAAVSVGALDSAVDAVGDRRVVLIAPASDVMLTAVNLPVRNPKRLLEAVPYALEDQLADDVENLHFALGPRDEAGDTPVAVVANDTMTEWLAPFLEKSIHVDLMLHELLCLPRTNSGAIRRVTLSVVEDEVLVRHDVWQGFVAALSELPAYLRIAGISEAEAPDELSRPVEGLLFADSDTQLDALQGLWPGDVAAAQQIISPLEACLHDLGSPDHVNLLQGPFQQRRAVDQWWQRLKTPVWLAAACLVAAMAIEGRQLLQLKSQVNEIESEALIAFKAAFPDISSPVYLREQAEQELRRLRSQASEGGLFYLLDETSKAMAKSTGTSLDGLQFRDNQLYLNIKARDLQALEVLRNRFAERSGLESEVQSANADSDGVKVRMRLKAVSRG